MSNEKVILDKGILALLNIYYEPLEAELERMHSIMVDILEQLGFKYSIFEEENHTPIEKQLNKFSDACINKLENIEEILYAFNNTTLLVNSKGFSMTVKKADVLLLRKSLNIIPFLKRNVNKFFKEVCLLENQNVPDTLDINGAKNETLKCILYCKFISDRMCELLESTKIFIERR